MSQCSVIIPAYNCENTLRETVKSVIESGLNIGEIIIVNDGSSDGTLEVARACQKQYGLIKVLDQDNLGVSAARNRGLQEATGDYIWFFDSDDLVDSGSMDYAAQIIDEREPDMLIFGMSFDYYRGELLYQQNELYYPHESEMTLEDVDIAFQELYRSNSLTSSCNKLIRRTVLTEHDVWFDQTMFSMEDFHFVLHALQGCERIYIIPRVIYHYVHRTVSMSNSEKKHASTISNIAEYLSKFKTLLSNHPDVFVNLYYIMLREKISTQNLRQIAATSKTFCEGPFSEMEYLSLCEPWQKKLAMQMIEHDYIGIYYQNVKAKIRKKIVWIVKQTRVYRRIRGQHGF